MHCESDEHEENSIVSKQATSFKTDKSDKAVGDGLDENLLP